MQVPDYDIAYNAFRDALNDLLPGWTVESGRIVGPDGASVRLAQRHESRSEGHVDVQFTFDNRSTDDVELWDCVSGIGSTQAARARFAAHLWCQTTACTWLELKYSRTGEFADHYRGVDTGGFTGWHSIAGAIVGFGRSDSPGALQRWWLENPVSPALAKALDGSLDEHECPYGLKILFGGDGVAEVRVNGEYHEAASKALADLPWPRLTLPGFVRSYALILHRH